MAFLGFSVRALLTVLAVILYVLGGITGGALHALLRKFGSRLPEKGLGRPAADWK